MSSVMTPRLNSKNVFWIPYLQTLCKHIQQFEIFQSLGNSFDLSQGNSKSNRALYFPTFHSHQINKISIPSLKKGYIDQSDHQSSGQIIFLINCVVPLASVGVAAVLEVYSYCPRPKIQWDMHERTEMYSSKGRYIAALRKKGHGLRQPIIVFQDNNLCLVFLLFTI